MTNKTEAPERIWAVADRRKHWQDEPPASGLHTGHWVKYTRADLPDAKDARIAELEAERDHWKDVAAREGVCMSCRSPQGAPDPYGCTDCLNTGYCGEHHNIVAELEAERDGYKEAYEDTKRLARLIDVALHGENCAAQQASLCDLVGPSADLKARAEAAEAELRVSLKNAERIDRVWGDNYAAVEAKMAKAEEALSLADAALSGANMNMNVVQKKVRATLAEREGTDQ